jgi:metal-responsive CopG/Arc/MetJ family transcriptional regulator
MKTAISVPDDIFGAAERHAKRIGVSRSRLYATALSAYLKSQQRNNVKEVLDRVYISQSSTVDPILDAMQQASIAREDW